LKQEKDKLNLLKADMIYTRVDDSSYTREHALTNSEIPNRTFLQSHFNPQMGFKMSSTARMMERKKRERPCKTFFIMAALDCNIKRCVSKNTKKSIELTLIILDEISYNLLLR